MCNGAGGYLGTEDSCSIRASHLQGNEPCLLFYSFLIHLLRMGEQLSDGLRETVLPWEFHTSWELWGSLKCCSISLLAVLCLRDSTTLGWPGAVETQTQLCSTQQPFRRYSGTGMMSRGTIAGRARLKAPAYTDQFPLSLPGDLGQVHVAEQSQSRCAFPEQPGTLPCVPVSHSPSEGAPHSQELLPAPCCCPKMPLPAAAVGL